MTGHPLTVVAETGPSAGGGSIQYTRALLLLVRLPSCLSGAALFVLGALSRGGQAGVLPVVLGTLSVVASVAHANVLNDITDREADAIDKKWRPLPSGSLSFRTALAAYGLCCVAAVALGCASGAAVGLWAIAVVPASAFYSYCLKSTVLLGNVTIALLASSPLLIGAVLAHSVGPAVLVRQAMIVTYMLGFEIIKTTADLRGDRGAGMVTVATKWGPRRALFLGMVSFCCACAISLGIMVFGSYLGLGYGIVFFGCIAYPVAMRYYRSGGLAAASPELAHQLFETMRRTWLLGFIGLIFLEWV